MEKSYSVKEAAKELGYSTNSMYGFLKEGLIKSVRIGNGKFKIPQSEIDKFRVGKEKENDVNLDKSLVVDEKKREAMQDMQVRTILVPGTLLPKPRPGKSLADLSGESVFHTLRLWFEERVGFPRLFDWLTSLTSIVLGVSLYLYSSQLDILSVGRLAFWMNPIRLAMILGGVGLILASMIRDEAGRKLNSVNYFRMVLVASFLGLAGILYTGKDIDGFLIHGLFGLTILIEALTDVRSSTVYMFYIFGLLVSVSVVFFFFPDGSGLSTITSALRFILDGYSWLLGVLVFVLLALGLYGYFWNKQFLKNVSFLYGVLLCVLALYYGVGNYWSRAFAVLLAGMVGMILPYWESFKVKIDQDRPLVFKMFGTVLMCFAIPMLLIAVMQKTLISNAYQMLSDKAELAAVMYANNIDNLTEGATMLAGNKNFIAAFAKKQNEELVNEIRIMSAGNRTVAIVGAVDAKGKPVAFYPASQFLMLQDFSKGEFLISVLRDGKPFVTNDLRTVVGGIDNVIVIGVPAVDAKNVVSGAVVVGVSGANISTELQKLGQKSLSQEVIIIDSKAKVVAHPDVQKLSSKISEADANYDLWKTGMTYKEGYDWKGVHSLFAAKKIAKYDMLVSVSEPVQKVLDVSSDWLAWVLFLQLIVGMVVFVSFMFVKNTRVKEEA